MIGALAVAMPDPRLVLLALLAPGRNDPPRVAAYAIHGFLLVSYYGLFFGAPHFLSRYLAPLAPLLILASVSVLLDLTQFVSRDKAARSPPRRDSRESRSLWCCSADYCCPAYGSRAFPGRPLGQRERARRNLGRRRPDRYARLLARPDDQSGRKGQPAGTHRPTLKRATCWLMSSEARLTILWTGRALLTGLRERTATLTRFSRLLLMIGTAILPYSNAGNNHYPKLKERLSSTTGAGPGRPSPRKTLQQPHNLAWCHRQDVRRRNRRHAAVHDTRQNLDPSSRSLIMTNPMPPSSAFRQNGTGRHFYRARTRQFYLAATSTSHIIYIM